MQDVLPADQGPVPPEAASGKTRFSAAAITGMVLVSIAWAILVRPLVAFTAWDVSDFSFLSFIAFSGLFTLLGGVTGFIAALIQGNKKLAARLYIIPSLIWQGGALAALFLLVIALSGYDGT
ncbi:hypothetical protein [Arthrobacter sp. zg-Y1116]|uniref:hypothetical protein n=1 Tax=Arthrobacter sp. zg-Y1116 TaxID=2964611 RepID=UPI00210460A2|nr:hypothetical protein [Arthrobacter sp. zg-Y1116]MCQ1947175.1 hypothetical protein [Arthrobacter sp. zg-Y1116]